MACLVSAKAKFNRSTGFAQSAWSNLCGWAARRNTFPCGSRCRSWSLAPSSGRPGRRPGTTRGRKADETRWLVASSSQNAVRPLKGDPRELIFRAVSTPQWLCPESVVDLRKRQRRGSTPSAGGRNHCGAQLAASWPGRRVQSRLSAVVTSSSPSARPSPTTPRGLWTGVTGPTECGVLRVRGLLGRQGGRAGLQQRGLP